MKKYELEMYSDLWKNPETSPYKLYRDLGGYGIVDPATGYEVTIEEDELYPIIIQKMLDAGVEVIEYQSSPIPKIASVNEAEPKDSPSQSKSIDDAQ